MKDGPLKRLERLLDLNPELVTYGRPIEEELVRRAQAVLDMTFPEDYKTFLSRWGTLAFGPIEIYGITGYEFENSSIPNAIWYTARKRIQIALPRNLLIVQDDNSMHYFCLDSEASPSSKVVIWNVRSAQIVGVRAQNLFDFISDEIEGFLA